MPTKLNPLLFAYSENLIELKSPNTKRGMLFQVWLILGIILAATDPVLIEPGKGFFRLFTDGDFNLVFAMYVIHTIPVICFFLWMFTPPSRLLFERASREVVAKHGNEEFRFPWTSIRTGTTWLPTKRGGVTFLTLKAAPPFPENVLGRIQGKKKLKNAGQLFFPLGGFDCRSPVIADAYMKFFSGFMESKESVGSLFSKTIGSVS